MQISIIIPTLNEAAHIESAIARAWQAGPLEVIVVDADSHDGTAEIARGLATQTLHSAPGRAVQFNAGACQAKGEVLLFLHADTWLARDGLRQIETVLADPAIVFGAFQQQIEAEGPLYRALELGNRLRAKYFRMPYGDQGIFMRRDAFEQLGGFPQVQLMEDVCLVRRARRTSRMAFLPGPLHVSARRWQRNGVIQQTLRNWTLVLAERCGMHPDTLARHYYTEQQDLHEPLAPPAGQHPVTDDQAQAVVAGISSRR